MSIVKVLATLSKIKEVVLIYRGTRSRTQPAIGLNRLTPLQEKLLDALVLKRYLPPVGHTTNRHEPPHTQEITRLLSANSVNSG